MNKAINCTEDEGSREQIMENKHLNELIREYPNVKKVRNRYENAENHICEIIRNLENGLGLSDDVFDEINNCIREIRTIDQEEMDAEMVARGNYSEKFNQGRYQ